MDFRLKTGGPGRYHYHMRDLLCAVQVNSFAVKLPGRAQGAVLAPG